MSFLSNSDFITIGFLSIALSIATNCNLTGSAPWEVLSPTASRSIIPQLKHRHLIHQGHSLISRTQFSGFIHLLSQLGLIVSFTAFLLLLGDALFFSMV